ncbi:DUF2782 domain-containing protein [Nitrosomonas communis]|uniref:DUF2782 domain-containing protein n=1 Tax=Nitrosomonas communis TaxID=44574 RepID=UPI0026ECB8F5|nr:DUF2782 domain-containing protein [Nitrosomonas communis]MCO6429054.1 DUF2782 domain-containing protein [Nitrosomonas communis]
MQPIKTILFLCAIWFTLSVSAQSNQHPKDPQSPPELPDLAPDEEPQLPDLPDLGGDPALEPQVTIIKGKEETVEEYRVNGQLYMIKVIPRIGKPFYLLNKRSPVGEPHRGDLEGYGVNVPMWELYRF